MLLAVSGNSRAIVGMLPSEVHCGGQFGTRSPEQDDEVQDVREQREYWDAASEFDRTSSCVCVSLCYAFLPVSRISSGCSLLAVPAKLLGGNCWKCYISAKMKRVFCYHLNCLCCFQTWSHYQRFRSFVTDPIIPIAVISCFLEKSSTTELLQISAFMYNLFCNN